MGEKMTDSNIHILELFARDKSMQSPLARRRERPYWDEIEKALENAFEYGGSARLDVLRPEDSYIKGLCMESLPKQFRIIVLTRDLDPKNELLEWWEPEASGFRGTVRFGDDEWDSRMVSSELAVAQKFFYELYEYGKLSHEMLLSLRSQWNPMPQ